VSKGLLLDTHSFLWWLGGSDELSLPARTAIENEQTPVFISAATCWEIATKHRLGKLPFVAALISNLDDVIVQQGFAGLPITTRHGQAAGALPGPHKDPFDRMLIVQAMINDLLLVSNEAAFDSYGVRRLW